MLAPCRQSGFPDSWMELLILDDLEASLGTRLEKEAPVGDGGWSHSSQASSCRQDGG